MGNCCLQTSHILQSSIGLVRGLAARMHNAKLWRTHPGNLFHETIALSYTQNKSDFQLQDLAFLSSTKLQSPLVENAVICTRPGSKRYKADVISQWTVQMEPFKRIKILYSVFMIFTAVLWYWLLLPVEHQQTPILFNCSLYFHKGKDR